MKVVALRKGFITFDCGNYIPNSETFVLISKIINSLENNNCVLSSVLIEELSKKDNIFLLDLLKDLSKIESKGVFLRPIFASSEKIENEFFSDEDFFKQLEIYYATYDLGKIPVNLIPSSRNVEVVYKFKDEKNKKINKVTFKSTDEYLNEVKSIINSPIVFGEEQLDFIIESVNNGIFNLITENDFNSKVKENIFSIIKIIGKEQIHKFKLLKTTTDVLRYAYFVSGEDFKLLQPGIKFSLKSSDKTVIMKTLNSLRISDSIQEMKSRKSQFLSLSKNLYPGSLKFKKYNNAQNLFNHFRNTKTLITFNSVTESLILNKDFKTLSKHLSEKPGEYIRTIDLMIRSSEDISFILEDLRKMKLNTKLVIQIRKYLLSRISISESRVINIKGKFKILEKEKILKPLEEKKVLLINEVLKEHIISNLMNKQLF